MARAPAKAKDEKNTDQRELGEKPIKVRAPRPLKARTDPISVLVAETILINKQALVFVNTKRSAESVAEELAKQQEENQFPELAKQILKALPSPTVQCNRLAFCVERGIAFHHAGLVAKQRELVEQHFIKGDLKVICATPTLAAGVNVPAFRVIIRDLYRFDGGMQEIPVLEYQQMAGRAGRPDFHDDYGEVYTIAKTPGDAQWIQERYWDGDPEPIYSKLGSLPALRTAVLSLYASRFVHTNDELLAFFARTFFAHQFRNIAKLEDKLEEVQKELEEWGFLRGSDATPLGRRVSQLYIDPLSAKTLLDGIASAKPRTDEAILHLVCSCIEMRPLLRLKAADFTAEAAAIPTLIPEPSMFSAEYEDFLQAAKTASMLGRWTDEAGEEIILEEFGVRPGELRAKISTADWLLYSAVELCRLLAAERREFLRARLRVKYGVKAELLPLLRLRGIGRIRARILFRAGMTSLAAVSAATDQKLVALLGPKTAASVRAQLERKASAPDNKL